VPRAALEEGEHDQAEVAVGEHLADAEGAATEAASATTRTAAEAASTERAEAPRPEAALVAVPILPVMMHVSSFRYIVR
jgi:hypothetical protein